MVPGPSGPKLSDSRSGRLEPPGRPTPSSLALYPSHNLSSQSGDHGVTVDPGSVERVEVLKGPITLLYGSNAIGGVANAITPHEALREDPVSGPRGHFTTDGGTANEQVAVDGSSQYGKGGWGFWAGGGARHTNDYDTTRRPP